MPALTGGAPEVTQAELDAVEGAVLVNLTSTVSNATGGTATGTYWNATGLAVVASGGTSNTFPDLFVFNSADWPDLASMSLSVSLATNAAQTATLTFGLYPATIGGATTSPSWTLGAVVSGSTVAFATPGTTPVRNTSGDFALPADGAYVIGVVISTAAIAANTRVGWRAALRGNLS